MRKIIILIKFFVTTSEGKFRKSMILPLLCILISSFVISFTNSITNGMEAEVENLIQAFTYPCEISTSSHVENNTSVNFGGNYTILLNEITLPLTILKIPVFCISIILQIIFPTSSI